jgi:hypothetical protein
MTRGLLRRGVDKEFLVTGRVFCCMARYAKSDEIFQFVSPARVFWLMVVSLRFAAVLLSHRNPALLAPVTVTPPHRTLYFLGQLGHVSSTFLNRFAIGHSPFEQDRTSLYRQLHGFSALVETALADCRTAAIESVPQLPVSSSVSSRYA